MKVMIIVYEVMSAGSLFQKNKLSVLHPIFIIHADSMSVCISVSSFCINFMILKEFYVKWFYV